VLCYININDRLNLKIISTFFLQYVNVARLGDKLMLKVPIHLFDSYDVFNKYVFYFASNFASHPGALQVPSFQLEWDLSHTMTNIALPF